eukprot:364744-Chlamydomonas_euryale.AAC.10
MREWAGRARAAAVGAADAAATTRRARAVALPGAAAAGACGGAAAAVGACDGAGAAGVPRVVGDAERRRPMHDADVRPHQLPAAQLVPQ